ncbi:MAG: hypothetical protein EON96_19350, partial [Caulobacteraceae bacterium]
MTGRICFIGNSHLGALRLAWGEADTRAGWTATFFAAPGGLMRGLVIEDGMLAGHDPQLVKSLEYTGGAARIDPSQYDLFVVLGQGFRLVEAASIYATHRLYEDANDRVAPVSHAALGATVRTRLARSAAIVTVRKLRKLTTAPVLLTPDPLPSSD